MSSRVISFDRSGNDPEVTNARRQRFANACKSGLLWLRNACGLLATAIVLAWLVVTFTH